MNPANNPCPQTLAQFLSRDLAGWRGLTEGCSFQDVASCVPLLPGEGVARLGTDIVEYRFRAAETAGFTEPVRLYFQDDLLALVRSGVWSFDRAECARLLRELGDPPDRLDLSFAMGVIDDGSWVYANRGLTLGVIPDTGIIVSVAAYPPCTLDAFIRRLDDREPPREFRENR